MRRSRARRVVQLDMHARKDPAHPMRRCAHPVRTAPLGPGLASAVRLESGVLTLLGRQSAWSCVLPGMSAPQGPQARQCFLVLEEGTAFQATVCVRCAPLGGGAMLKPVRVCVMKSAQQASPARRGRPALLPPQPSAQLERSVSLVPLNAQGVRLPECTHTSKCRQA
jgi:hypothetical protein